MSEYVQATAANPSDMTQVPRELSMLKGAVECLDKRLSELLTRLHDVTRSSEPKLSEVSPDSFPVSTPLACEIRRVWEQVGDMEHRVESQLQRLEL